MSERIAPPPGPQVPQGQNLLAVADAGFALLVFFLSLRAFTFYPIHPPLWLLAYGYLLIRILFCLRIFLLFLSRNLIYLAYPGICLLSVLWSETPIESLKFSIQLSITVLMALFIAMRFSIAAIFALFQGLSLALMGLSLINLTGIFVHPYNQLGKFIGIFLSKNTLGQNLILFAIGCVTTLVMEARAQWRDRLIYGFGLVLTVFLLGIAGSATGTVLSAAMIGLALVLHVLTRHPGSAPLILLPLLVIGVSAGFALVYFQIDPIADTLRFLGRSPTLTGRTDLWGFGWGAYLDKPVLGYGANAFWNSPHHANFVIGLQSIYGSTVLGFHNLFVELLVMAGPLGLITNTAMVWATLSRAIRWLGRDGGGLAIWALVVALAIWGQAIVGTTLIKPHDAPLILMVAIGAALGKKLPVRGGNS